MDRKTRVTLYIREELYKKIRKILIDKDKKISFSKFVEQYLDEVAKSK